MFYKQVLGILAVLIGLVGYVSYFQLLLARKIRPHAFTWLIWALIAGITFAAQLYDGGGPGAWTTGMNCVGCVLVFFLSLERGETNITTIDWAFFLTGLGAIPLWLATRQPLYSVLLVTLIDSLGYGPTFRKSYHEPYQESVVIYSLGIFGFICSVLAMEHQSLITCLYPASSAVLNSALVSMILLRRGGIKKP